MKTYQFLPQILLRTPAFSFKDYSALKLKTILKNNYFQKALLIASSSLYHQLEKTGFDYEQLSHREQQSVRKYFNRLCFRPTPFGAFSTFSVVNWGPELYIEVKKQRIHLTKSFAEAIIAGQILKHSMGREQLQYKVNQTLYESADDLRYLAAFPNEENTAFEFSIKSISNMPVLKKLKTFCAPERSYNELINFLTGEQIERAEAGQLIDELIGIQFLTDNLMPNITGQDYLEKIAPKQFKSLILPVSNSQINFNNSNRLAENIPDANKVYVNTEGLSGGSLNPEHQETLLKALNCLFSFSSRPASAGNLADFIAAYQKKFEGRALPLLYVLDPETGIGYRDLADHLEGKELIQEINWPSKSSPKLITQWSAAHSLLLKKWHQAGPVISIDETDLPPLREAMAGIPRPPSISVIFRIVDQKLLIESAGGVSAISLIGRFTPFNKAISTLSDAIVQRESSANPDVIFAEIAHICNFHKANINRREHTYKYEIPVLVTSTVDTDFQIPLSDLCVSVIQDEVILYSKKNNKRVIPRLSSAFNYVKNDLAVFRFLCDLQHQGIPGSFNFDLGTYFPDLNYYPRVEFLNSILQLATWRVSKNEFKALWPVDKELRYLLFKKIKDRLGLPKWAALSVHDHQLVFNLTHKDEVEFFLQTIKNQDFIVIKEFLYPSAKDSMLVTSKRKPLINQFIASLYHQEQVYKPASLPIENKQKPTRRLTPGSDWLYFKLYCHPARANEIIAGKVLPLLQPLMRQNAIDQWFYVRYTDPDFHLRLRLKVRAESMVAVSSLVNNHLNYLLKKQKIASYTIAIYERELERYGYDQITEFEKLFYQSSHLIATYLNQALADGGQPDYYLFGFSTARVMMDCFQLDGLARIFYLEKLVASYFTEFNGDAGLKYQLDQKFRKVQELLGKGEVYVPQIKERALEFKNALSLFYIKNKTLPTSKLNGWLADLIHMHLNRLFTDDARKQEFVLYYLMLKYEKAVYAKNKNVAAHTV